MFSEHPKSKYWSDKNILRPDQVKLNSHKKIWFDCDKCGHCFDSQLNEINILNRWCSYCANKKLCDKSKNCTICIEKSFASVSYSEYWSDKNEVSPCEVLKKSHKKYLFDCPKCKHLFQQCLSHITRGNTCPYCHSKLLCDTSLNCKTCYNKTFASVERSINWSNKNIKKPNEVFKSVATKYWFDCDKCGNEFESKLSHITDGSWCPRCRYKTEDKLFKILIEKYPKLKSQYKVDWCKDKKHLPFDFVIEERKIIVELDGCAHFKQVAKWKSPEHNRSRDLYKMKCANENGFSVIRILQEDVFKNKYNWLNELCENIEKITDENRVQNIYMCKNNEYKDFDIN
jgi:very-short-patch-repair endonuclease